MENTLHYAAMIEHKHLRPVKLFTSSEQVRKLRMDLEASTREEFKRIDRARMQSSIDARNYVLD